MLRPFCVGYTLYVSLSCLKSVQKSIKGVDFAELGVTPEEIEWLKKTCPFLKHDYIAYLSTFRLKPEQVSLEFKPKADDPSLGRNRDHYYGSLGGSNTMGGTVDGVSQRTLFPHFGP